MSENQKHTPGPWETAPVGGAVRIFGGSHYIGIIGNSDDSDAITQANARLIAAAPTMLQALEDMRANIERWLETGEPASTEESKTIYDQIVRAIEQAKGETR